MTNVILSIIQTTVPALVVFFTVFYLFKQYLRHQYHLASLQNQKKQGGQILPLKLQAYERLALFCERVSTDTLLYRINNPDMDGRELRTALLIAIQQEFEHNLTQQIYVSENLWKIIRLGKDQWQAIISATEGATNAAFISDLYQKVNSMEVHPIDYAKVAIKKEVEVLLN